MGKMRDGDLGVPATDFLLAVQRGRVDGAKIVSKFGYNYAVGTSEPMQTIWEGSPANAGVYSYALQTPSTIDLLSTDATDTQVLVTVEGLDTDGNEISEEFSLNGTTPVTSSQVFWRVFRAYNSSNVDLIGDVEGFVSGSLLEEDQVLFISFQSQQTLFGGYTIPKGKTGYTFGLHVTTGKGKECRIGMFTRRVGGVFRQGDLVVSYQGTIDKEIPFIKVPELTDIEARGVSDSDNTNVSVRFDVLLLDNDLFEI